MISSSQAAPTAPSQIKLSGALPGVSPFLLQLVLMTSTIVVIVLIGDQSAWNAEVRLQWLSRFALLQLVFQITILLRCFRSPLAPPLVFSFFLSIFSSGWLILRSFNLHAARYDVISRLSPESINDATQFYLLSYAAYGLGVAFVGSRPARPRAISDDALHEARETEYRRSLSIVGDACIAIGVGPFLASTVNNLLVVVRSGYSAYYDQGSRLESPLLALAPYFTVGLIISALAADAPKARWAIRAVLVLALIRFAVGDRGEGFIYLITAAMARHYSPHNSGRLRFSRLRLALLVSGSVVLIPLIGSLRQRWGQAGGISVSGIAEDNPIVGTLRTMGGTLYPLVTSMELVPSNQNYLYGGTYLSGVLRIFPGFLRPSWSLDSLYASPATWLQQQKGLSYGPGFTPFAEAYINFGVIGGCVALFMMGVIATRVLHISTEATLRRIVFVVIVFALCGFVVRGSFNAPVPFIVRYAMVPMLAARLIMAARSRRRIEIPR